MADFHVTLRVRNGRIIRRMRELGIETIAELSRRSGVSQSRLGELVSFKCSPIAKGGKNKEHRSDWNQYALSVSAALGMEPEELWPDHIAKLKARKGEVGFYADEEELKSLPANNSFIDQKAIEAALNNLTPRERDIIERRFGLTGEEETCEMIGERYHISRSRSAQIVEKVIRKLRHPSSAKLLMGAVSSIEHRKGPPYG